MYGFVNNATTEILLFDSREEAIAGATAAGLTSVRIRRVVDHSTGDGRRRAREAEARRMRTLRDPATPAAPSGEMGSFLALGQ